jgi:hypothetical protein
MILAAVLIPCQRKLPISLLLLKKVNRPMATRVGNVVIGFPLISSKLDLQRAVLRNISFPSCDLLPTVASLPADRQPGHGSAFDLILQTAKAR